MRSPEGGRPSVTQIFPSLSTWNPWGKMNIPAPKLVRGLPDGLISRTGARFEPAQLFRPHLSASHMLPARSTPTALVAPQVLPSGSLAQFATGSYGFGREFIGCRTA